MYEDTKRNKEIEEADTVRKEEEEKLVCICLLEESRRRLVLGVVAAGAAGPTARPRPSISLS